SSLVMRPATPDPFTEAPSMPFSARILLADGDGVPAAYPGDLSAAAFVSPELSEAGAAGLEAAGLPPPAAILQTVSPIARVAPSSAIWLKTPAVSAVSSNVALSDSSSAICWSISTDSPFATIHRDNVTSVID